MTNLLLSWPCISLGSAVWDHEHHVVSSPSGTREIGRAWRSVLGARHPAPVLIEAVPSAWWGRHGTLGHGAPTSCGLPALAVETSPLAIAAAVLSRRRGHCFGFIRLGKASRLDRSSLCDMNDRWRSHMLKVLYLNCFRPQLVWPDFFLCTSLWRGARLAGLHAA